MGLGTFFGRLLGRPDAESSRSAAKDRLRLVLMHDRTDIPATMMEAIRAEMVQVLSKYVEIDQEALAFQLERDDGAIGLVLNIPIIRVKTELEAAEALETMHAVLLQEEAETKLASATPVVNAPVDQPATGDEPGDADAAEDAAPEVGDPEAADDDAPVEATDEPQPVAAAPVEATGTRTVTVPVRLFSNLKAPDATPASLFAPRAEEDGDDRPRVLRDAWYSAEELLQPTASERSEPND